MTPILKKQLTMLCGAAVLTGAMLWTGDSPRAQDSGSARTILGIKTPRIPLSRDEAARQFVALLESMRPVAESQPKAPEEEISMLSSFSISSETEALGPLLERMAVQWKQPISTVKVQSEDADKATVTVEPPTAPVPRPLVVVREGDSWGVDVVETYANWNGLAGESTASLVSKLANMATQARLESRRASCQSNLKQIGLGMMMYVQDYDEKLPPAKPWIDLLQPYVKSGQIFKCPEVTDEKGYGYAYNSKLSGKSYDILSSPAETVSVYETMVLKRNAYGMGENPAYRHQNGANYAFTDGHVKWLEKGVAPSFNLKP